MDLPPGSADERDPDDDPLFISDVEERERWLKDNVPPHHG